MKRFFEGISRRLDVAEFEAAEFEAAEFEAAEFVVEGDTVVVFGHEAGVARATGQSFRNEWPQKCVVREGLVVEMTEYNV